MYWDWIQEGLTQNAYAHTAVKFIACCLRCLSREHGKFCLPLTPKQQRWLLSLEQSLIKLGSLKPSSDTSNQVLAQQGVCETAFQNAFFFLATGCLDSSNGSRFDSPLYCFLAVSFLDEQGKFAEPKNMTSHLAQWKFLLRCTLMRFAHAHPHPNAGIIGFVSLILIKSEILISY
jgi:hypothetical protein